MQRGRQYQHLAWLQTTLCLLLFACARPTRAQIPTYTTPQTVQQTLANSVACTGSAQDFTVQNLGQVVHQFTILTNTGVTSMQASIFASDGLGNTFQISDSAYPTNGTNPNVLVAAGYYPSIFIQITCSGSGGSNNFSITYAGASSFSSLNQGALLKTSLYKTLALGVTAGSNFSAATTAPFGNTSGSVFFNFVGGAGPSGSTITLQCLANGQPITFNLNTAAGTQTFQVPPTPCPIIEATYTSGGASTDTFTFSYLFNEGGSPVNTTLGSYSHITGTTATAVKAVPGTLVSLNVNTPASGTVSIFDLATASCTGTPATNTVAVITASATAPLGTFFYNLQFLNGICVKASAAMDLTVSYQ